MKNHMKTLLPVLVLIAGGGAFFILRGSGTELQTRPPNLLLPTVRTIAIEAADLQITISSQGTIRPRTESTLVPQVSGVITWVSDSWASGGFFARNGRAC